jgi:hypothetical protein
MEPLQSARFEEEKKATPGRTAIELSEDFADGSEYRIYYQDTMGWWHITGFRFRSNRLVLSFHGGNRFTTVPPSVRDTQQVQPASSLERLLHTIAVERHRVQNSMHIDE